MKKLIFSMLFWILLIPMLVSAEEKCKVVSGNGKDIGSEIACGNEHFYIVSSDEDKIKMLAKYNLYVGFNIDKIKINKNETYIKKACRENIYSTTGYYCDASVQGSEFYFEGEKFDTINDWKAKLFEKYHVDVLVNIAFPDYVNDNSAFYFVENSDIYEENGNKYMNEYYKIYPYEYLGEDGIQNEKALGVTGEKGNANYPLYGVTSYAPKSDFYDYYYQNGEETFNKYKDGFVDIDIQFEPMRNYLNNYMYYLDDEGYEIEDIDLISVREIDNLVKKITKQELPLTDWYNASIGEGYDSDDDSRYIKLGDLKEYLSDDYKWLWQTTYWTKTLVEQNSDYNQFVNAYFVSTAGDICFSIVDCSSGVPRAGIRPLLTINRNNIEYNIITNESKNGTIDIVNTSLGGEEVQVIVSANKGFKLKELAVSTESGEKINIIDNKFIMPYENVIVEASFEPIYKFVEGMGQEYNVANENKLRFRVNIEYEDFLKNGIVVVDDKEVDSKYYKLSEGSTIITFEKEFSDSLKTGKHEIVAKLSGGESATTDFIIKKNIIDRIEEISAIKEIVNPETSDKILLVIVLFIGTIVLFKYNKSTKEGRYRL